MNLLSRKFIIFCLLLILVFSINNYSAIAENTQSIWIEGNDKCVHGLHHQPNGPMAVVLFCEDAVGTYLGIIYYELMEAPAPSHFVRRLSEKDKITFYNNWSLGNRMWQEPVWASDITSYAWGADGTKLYVATSNIYGSGAFYELDIVRKTYKQIAPKDKEVTIESPGPGFVISRIDLKQGRLFFKIIPRDFPPDKKSKEQFINIAK